MKDTNRSPLIFDITQLAHWQGRLTGIPRVMHELAVRYKAQDDVTFVSWEVETASFYEVDIEHTLARRGERIFYTSVNAAAPSASEHVKQSVVKRALKKAYRVARSLNVPGTKQLEHRLTVVSHTSHRRVVPTKGQTLFIPWGEWADSNYTDAVSLWADSGVDVVPISHDILPLITPQFSGHSTESMRRCNELVIPKCSLVLAVSENSKKDLANWLKDNKLNVPRIEVIRNGDTFSKVRPSEPKDATYRAAGIKSSDFLLSVGTIEARKNHWLLYYVYKLAKQRGIDLPPLVIVGRRGYRTDDMFEITTTDPEVNNKIIFLLNASDAELAWLYSNARFTVQPAFYEGWGIPVAESLSYGTPSICSNTSSLPEVAGDLVGYFSPNSTDECLAQVTRLLEPKEYAKAIKKTKQFKPASWDQTFKQTDKFIRSLHDSKN